MGAFCFACNDINACQEAQRCLLLRRILNPVKQKKEEGTGVEIYNLLLSGHTLRLTFPDLLAARSFRNYIATVKSRQEKVDIASGLFLEEEVPLLSVDFEKIEPEVSAVFSFIGERRGKKVVYEILSFPPASSSSSSS